MIKIIIMKPWTCVSLPNTNIFLSVSHKYCVNSRKKIQQITRFQMTHKNGQLTSTSIIQCGQIVKWKTTLLRWASIKLYFYYYYYYVEMLAPLHFSSKVHYIMHVNILLTFSTSIPHNKYFTHTDTHTQTYILYDIHVTQIPILNKHIISIYNYNLFLASFMNNNIIIYIYNSSCIIK